MQTFHYKQRTPVLKHEVAYRYAHHFFFFVNEYFVKHTSRKRNLVCDQILINLI